MGLGEIHEVVGAQRGTLPAPPAVQSRAYDSRTAGDMTL